MGKMPTELEQEIARCDLCRTRFAATATAHSPRPVVWFRPQAPILIAGQAPGMRVHESGRPFDDRSGDRLRHWMGVEDRVFYDRDIVSILPTSFCFPGYSVKGADLPPPPLCWDTWHRRCLTEIGHSRLRLIVGGYAMRRHLGHRGSVTEAVRRWRDRAPHTFVLPHPSWRNTAWLRANPWFQHDVLPVLRQSVQAILDDIC